MRHEKTGFVKSASDAVQGVIDLSAPVTQSGSVAAALTVPYVKTSRSRSDEETVAWWCLQHKRSRANWVAEMGRSNKIARAGREMISV